MHGPTYRTYLGIFLCGVLVIPAFPQQQQPAPQPERVAVISFFAPTVSVSVNQLLLVGRDELWASHRESTFTPMGAGWWVKQPTSWEQALDSTLAALRERGASQSRLSQQLADVMMRLADNDRRPTWPVIVNFTDKLTSELIGRQLDIAQTTTMRECMIGVMRRTGSNARLARSLQETLAGIGIESSKIQLVVTDFIAIGEAVRGPDDLPLRSAR